MAAATVRAESFKSEAVKLWEAGLIARHYEHASSSDLDEAGDIVRFFKLPRGAKILWGRLRPGDFDSNGTPTIVLSVEITDGTTVKTLIHQAAVGQTGGLAFPTSANFSNEDALGFVIPADGWEARVLVDTVAATTQAAAVSLQVDYNMDLEQGEAP